MYVVVFVLIIISIAFFIVWKDLIDEEQFGSRNIDCLFIDSSRKKNRLFMSLGFTDQKMKLVNLKEKDHFLVMGTTGGGKSICLTEIVSSFLLNYSEEDIKMLTIDTSLVELSSFNGVPHYLKNTLVNPSQIMKELQELLKLVNASKFPKKPLLVIIDDFYDVCSYDRKVLGIIEELLEKSKGKNIHFILATDTPVEDILTEKIQKNVDGFLYLTLSPGYRDYLPFSDKITEEDDDYLTLIGNAIYHDGNRKYRIHVPEIYDEDIQKIKEWLYVKKNREEK